jgi:hypothetical protein
MNREGIEMSNSRSNNKNKFRKIDQSYVQLIKEAEAYISFLEKNNPHTKNFSGTRNLNPDQMYISLRNQEREENNKIILQYLIIFLEFVCFSKKIERDFVNPFEQFRNFVLFNIHLLKEVDVIQAIIRYGQKSNELKNNWNEYYWRLKISRIYHQSVEMIKDRANNSMMDCYNCIEVLKELCQFWFDIHYKNNCPIRHCDILTYKICKALLKILEQKQAEN